MTGRAKQLMSVTLISHRRTILIQQNLDLENRSQYMLLGVIIPGALLGTRGVMMCQQFNLLKNLLAHTWNPTLVQQTRPI